MTITPAPDGFAATRDSLHRLARYVITPRRQQIDGRERLIQLPGGFGTPVLSTDLQMRVDGVDFVVAQSGSVVREPITTLRRAGELVNVEPSDHTAKPDIPQMGDIDETLTVDSDAAAYLARWFAFSSAVLAALLADEASTDATDIVIWSHHFDPSIELLADNHRASYGGSPGDGTIAEPYFYVAPWSPDDVAPDPYWNAEGYVGSALRASKLSSSDHALGAAIDFLRRGRDLLAVND